jgi:periplasmic protein TonB
MIRSTNKFFLSILLRSSTWRRVVCSGSVSTITHLLVVVAFLGYLYRHPAHVVNPAGTPTGRRIDLVYLPGRARAATLHSVAKRKVAAVVQLAPSSAAVLPPLPSPALPHVMSRTAAPAIGYSPAPPSDAIDQTKGSNSWGSEDAQQIALTTYSPSPKPDLSVLPRGVQGDVIVDVTINSDGRIGDLTVLKTVGYGIEASVINTVRTWTFQPATRGGVPVASVQELLFHFDRRESP